MRDDFAYLPDIGLLDANSVADSASAASATSAVPGASWVMDWSWAPVPARVSPFATGRAKRAAPANDFAYLDTPKTYSEEKTSVSHSEDLHGSVPPAVENKNDLTLDALMHKTTKGGLGAASSFATGTTETTAAFDLASAASRAKGGGYVFTGTGKGRCPGPAVGLGSSKDFRVTQGDHTYHDNGPLAAFTKLGADILFIGDSTDKLLVLSGCSAALPANEQCDPSMSHLGIPTVTQVAHNMRPFVLEADDAELGFSLLSDARLTGGPASLFDAVDATGCCSLSSGTAEKEADTRGTITSAETEKQNEETKCCMTSQQARTASACAVGDGAAGSVHVFGPGDGPYLDGAGGVSEDLTVYDGYALPRQTSRRVAIALARFTAWASARAAWTRSNSQSVSTADSNRKADAALGAVYGVLPDAGVGARTVNTRRPVVVVINTNYWAQKFWGKADLGGGAGTDEAGDVVASPVGGAVTIGAASLGKSDDALPNFETENALQTETEDQGVQTHFKDLQKYEADLLSLVTSIEATQSDTQTVCVVLRTQHDMLLTETDAVANKRRCKSNARTRAINAVIEKLGKESNVAVFPWAQIFNERLEKNIFDGWCHQWGDTSVYMQRRFNTWATAHLPRECFLGGGR